MSALTDAFLPYVKNTRLQKRCIAIDTSRKIIRFEDGEEFDYDTMISSVPLPRLIAMMSNIPEHIMDAASQLKSNAVHTVNLGIDREHISEKHWVYFPEKKYLFQRVSFPANFSASLAPPGTSSVMAEISSSAYRSLPEVDLIEHTTRQLREIGILRSSDRVIEKSVKVIDPAYIIFDRFHSTAVSIVRDYLRSKSIITCGRFGEWQYFNMDQTILSGKQAAEVAKQL
jgi:UDP-galactopyranose mutase